MKSLIGLLELLIVELYTVWKRTRVGYSWRVLSPSMKEVNYDIVILNSLRLRARTHRVMSRIATGYEDFTLGNGFTYRSVKRKRVPLARLSLTLSVVGVN